MKFKELDIVKLKNDDDKRNVKSNFFGVVVDVQANGQAINIEFVNEAGCTVLEALEHYYSPNELIKQ